MIMCYIIAGLLSFLFIFYIVSLFDTLDDDLPHNIYIGSGERMKEYWDKKWKEPMKEIRTEWVDEKGQKCFSVYYYR